MGANRRKKQSGVPDQNGTTYSPLQSSAVIEVTILQWTEL